MMDLALQIAEFLLNLLGLVGAIILAFVAMCAVAWLLVWLKWRVQRRRVRACAARIAAGLSLTSAQPPDSRMQFWLRRAPEHELWLATFAMYDGPAGAALDPYGPGFFGGAPRLTFARYMPLLLVVRLATAIPDPFTLSTMRSAEANLDTGDALFDQWFKLSSTRSVAALRLFSSAPLRDALLAIYGPDRDPSGTGLMVAANEGGLVICWSAPRAERAEEFARAVAHAVERLLARRDFF